MLNHICRDTIYSSQFNGGYTCTSLGGPIIKFTVVNGNYYCNDFPIVRKDVPTANGVVHIINGLLFFEAEEITPAPTEVPTTEVITETTSEKETTISIIPEVTTVTMREPEIINVTEPSELYPTTKEPIYTTEYPTSPSSTAETTVSLEVTSEITEYTTIATSTIQPNATIPDVFEQKFEMAGYPINVTAIQILLLKPYQYTACVPHSMYLKGISHELLISVTTNISAITSKFLKQFNNLRILHLQPKAKALS